MPNQLFPELPEGWSVSNVEPLGDHFRIDDRHQGKLYEGTQAQCSQFITWHTQPEQTQHAMGDQRDLYQVRDGYTGRILAGFRTIDDANQLAFNIENGLPYAGVPAGELSVEFWRRQPDGQYRQMTIAEVGAELEAGAPEQPREQVARQQQPELLPGWKHVHHDSFELGALVIRGSGNHWSLVDGRWAPEPHLGTFATPQAAAREAARLIREDPELRQSQGQEQPQEQQQALAPHHRYRQLLAEISDLRYPDADATLRRKIEVSIDKKVAEFMAERGELPKHARAREQQQQIQPPPPRQQQRGMSYEH